MSRAASRLPPASLRPASIYLAEITGSPRLARYHNLWCTCLCFSDHLRKVSNPFADSTATTTTAAPGWSTDSDFRSFAVAVPRRPSAKSLLLACCLFLVTLGTCLVAGTHFAVAYAHNEAVAWDEFIRAFILIRSPIRTTRALFDVGASGPLVGFLVAVPALIYGIVHAKFVPNLADPANAGIVLGSPLILQLLAPIFHHGANASTLLLHPVGRAAWVGLFATSLNLLPAVQLDGGHIIRSLSQRAHRVSSIFVPLLLAYLGFRFWPGWYVWAALLVGIRFLRTLPIYHPEPLGSTRYAAAFLSLIIFILCFMPAPFLE